MARAIDADELLKQQYTMGFGQIPVVSVDAIKNAPTLTPPNEWVSVEERLPPPKQNVLAYSPESGIAEADYGDGVWMQYRWSAVMRGVTHWMPLPAPPGKGNNVPTNEPLSIEQLRKMDGQPAWVKVIGKTGIRCDGWCEVEIRDKDPFAYVWWPGSEVEDIAKIEDYGKTWACYAYPPARIDREGWVSVEERLPEDEKDGETVLVIVFGKPHENITLHGAIMTAGYFRDEGWVLNEYPEWEGPEVTHWMPLPSPPDRRPPEGEED